MAWSLHRSLPAAAHSDGLVPTRPNGRVGRSAKSGTLGDYKGGRSLDQLMAFANKLISPMLQTGTAALIRAARQASPVVFVFVDADDSRRAVSASLAADAAHVRAVGALTISAVATASARTPRRSPAPRSSPRRGCALRRSRSRRWRAHMPCVLPFILRRSSKPWPRPAT